GRAHDVELLRERWRLAGEGHGQAVLVCGEAGMGKSRLLRELRRELDAEVPSWLACHCSPYHGNSALFPMVELLERWIGTGAAAERLGRLEELLGQHGLSVPENAPLFAALLSLPAEGRYPPLYLSPEGQRKRTLEALLALLVEQAERQPSLLVVEDLHWIDPSTLEPADVDAAHPDASQPGSGADHHRPFGGGQEPPRVGPGPGHREDGRPAAVRRGNDQDGPGGGVG